jgi:hypothetical protein
MLGPDVGGILYGCSLKSMLVSFAFKRRGQATLPNPEILLLESYSVILCLCWQNVLLNLAQ